MVIPEKTYSSNPFVDNVVYYAKYLAMNCSVKDQFEAEQNETKESLYAGDLYIACIEGRATYEMFQSFPKEIIEKYITSASNLDLYAEDPSNLKTRLNNFTANERTIVLNRLSSLARTVYIDHFNTMTRYLNEVGPNWLTDNLALYNACLAGTADYNTLFDVLPLKTNLRIIKTYLNSHGYLDLAVLWDPDSSVTRKDLAALEQAISDAAAAGTEYEYDTELRNKLTDPAYISAANGYNSSDSTQINQLRAYITYRSDEAIIQEINHISSAMRSVFISHYEIMRDRKYFNDDINNEDGAYNLPTWSEYYFDRNYYQSSQDGSATWEELFNFFPKYKRTELIAAYIPTAEIIMYSLDDSPDALKNYIDSYTTNSPTIHANLSKDFRDVYIANYQLFLNQSVYYDCINGILSIYDLYPYLPPETLKSIIATEIPEISNIQSYTESKDLLNSYLNTLPVEQANTIKNNIVVDMLAWYPKNHVERNNYYRSLIGLPPMDANGNVYVDTLIHTWDAKTSSFIEFGNRYTSMIPDNVYPEQHWRNQLYTFDSYDISVLSGYGVLEDYVTGCGSTLDSTRYRYLKYLGDNKLNLYECRKAMNFDLIGLPAVDNSDIKAKFVDTYVVNSDYVTRAVFSEAYRFQSEYYNKFMIIFILMNTMMDLLSEISDFIINRDVFDARCIRYIFESYGVPYYSEIPLKYQHAMLKNLNILLKYKSSTKNMVDICSLFGFDDIKVFGYYLMKDRTIDSDGEYVVDISNNLIAYDVSKVYIRDDQGSITDISGRKFSKLDQYRYYRQDYFTRIIKVKSGNSVVDKRIIRTDRDLYVLDNISNEMIPLRDVIYLNNINASTDAATLKFVRVPIQESVADYKNDSDHIVPYDEVTQEITWDGDTDHEVLKRKILQHEFNAVKTKYISIESITSLTDVGFQMSYFYNMLFDNIFSENFITLQIPSIQMNHNFRLPDVLFYLFALTYYYLGVEDKIMYSPTQILYVKGYNFNDAFNEIINDSRYFDQSVSPKTDCFDINTRISQEAYDYLERFDKVHYRVKGFNLNADIDELEAWLQKEWQMSLDDFVVSEDIEKFGQVLTLRQFYTLNNSYYQKNIFNGTMKPMQFNNLIKYAYSYELVPKIDIDDADQRAHSYIYETMEIDINSKRIVIAALVARSGKSSYNYPTLVTRCNAIADFSDLSIVLSNRLGVTNTAAINDINNTSQLPYYSEIVEEDENGYIYVHNIYKYAQNTMDGSIQVIYNKYRRSGTDYTITDNRYYIMVGDTYRTINNSHYNFLDYDAPINRLFIMTMQTNMEYNKYAYDASNNRYYFVNLISKRYVMNSESKYITVLDTSTSYSDTKRVIATLNRSMILSSQDMLSTDETYNPSLHDGIWDENDWFYSGTSSDPNNVTNMHGENLWYYKDPNDAVSPEADADVFSDEVVGSGIYIPQDEYIHAMSIEAGKEYYFSMDIETNFNGEIHVFNTADPNYLQRVYAVKSREVLHINQIFVARNITSADIRIIRQNFTTNPINIGDYVVVSNVIFSQAYSEHYIPTDITSITELQNIYATNTAIYKWLTTQMVATTNKKKYDLYKKLYDSLMVCKYNKEIFRLSDNTYARTYTEFLSSRDEVLYESLIHYKDMEPEVMRKSISDSIIDIIYNLNELITGDDLQHIYSYFPAVGTSFVQSYIYKVINWFKSWKVQLLGIRTVYRMGDGAITDASGNIIAEMSGNDFLVKILHDQKIKVKINEHLKDGFVKDEVKVNPIFANSPDGTPYADKYDFSDARTVLHESVGIKDRVRVMVNRGNIIEFRDDEMHIILTDNSSKAYAVNGHDLHISTTNGDRFNTANKNNMIVSSTESPETVFAAQSIEDINYLSGDYINFEEQEEEE